VMGEASVAVTDWVAKAGHGARALNSLILRSLKQAYYDARNRGHAGLASPRYCHFTSPIRRYPDLICHRALLSAIAGEPAPEASWVQQAGPWCSTREREAMTIERDADDVARCFLLERELFTGGEDRDRMFAGEVVGLIGAGAFVAFGERAQFEGMLPVRRLGGDWWELNEQGTVLVGTRNGGTVRLGDPIEVAAGCGNAWFDEGCRLVVRRRIGRRCGDLRPPRRQRCVRRRNDVPHRQTGRDHPMHLRQRQLLDRLQPRTAGFDRLR